jgi:hypothetical protein
LLKWLRDEAGVAHPVVLPLVGEGLPGPQARQDVQPLVELGGPHPVVAGVAEVGEVQVGGPADAHARYDPAPGEVVEGDGLASEGGGPAAGEESDHGPEADPLGDLGHRSEGDPGVGDEPRPVVGADVVLEKEAFPPGRLCATGKVEQVAGVGEVPEVGQGEGEVQHLPIVRVAPSGPDGALAVGVPLVAATFVGGLVGCDGAAHLVHVEGAHLADEIGKHRLRQGPRLGVEECLVPEDH